MPNMQVQRLAINITCRPGLSSNFAMLRTYFLPCEADKQVCSPSNNSSDECFVPYV